MKLPGPLVEVEWIDTFSSSGWQHPGELEELLKGPGGMMTRTVGYLISQAKDRVVLCMSANVEGATCEVTIIPRGCIKKVHRHRAEK